MPAPEAMLSLGALGLALASASRWRAGPPAGSACAGSARSWSSRRGPGRPRLRRRRRSTAAGTAPSSSWPAELAFTHDLQYPGQFRILWVGDPSVLPLDPAPVGGGLSYVLTRDGPGDGRELQRAPVTRRRRPGRRRDRRGGGGPHQPARARCSRRWAIRYVVFTAPRRAGRRRRAAAARPRRRAARPARPRPARQRPRASSCYQNQAWFPGEALVSSSPGLDRRPGLPTRPAPRPAPT